MSKSAAGAVARTLPSFKLGQKQVFIPAHVVTLLRRTEQPPNWATFQVPLRFSKFDLRDYLWNLYGLEAHRIRSVVKISKPEGARRPPSTKIMTIEMAQPFAWPAVPEDKEPWNNKLHTARVRSQDQQYEQMKKRQHGGLVVPSEAEARSAERKDLRRRAEELLRGEREWKSDAKLDPKWSS